MHRKEVVRGTPEYGHAFEHFVMQELMAYIRYNRKEEKLSYWRTNTGLEVDAIVGDRLAIEIKSTEDIQNKHIKNLKAFKEEHPHFRLLTVSLDKFTRKIDDIELYYIHDFLHLLWSGELF